LASESRAAVRLVAPATPVGGTRTNRSAWAALSAVVQARARRRQLTIRPRGTLDLYCDDVAASALVIGCDTSSQHLAHAIGRPSITCYPTAIGRHLHLFWGPIHDQALHFDTPPDDRARDQRSLAGLMARLSVALVEGGVAGPSRRTANGSRLAADAMRFVDCCSEYLRGRRAGRQAAAASLRRLHQALPPDWAPHVTDELARIYADLPAVRASSAAARRMARARLQHLNAPRVARLLGAGRDLDLRSAAAP
jgi:hypothetical protein